MKNVILITDLDNTIYNFMDYFAPSFRGMLHALSSKLGIGEDTLTLEFREIFKKYNSIEYPFSVQELPSVISREEEEIKEIIKVARGAYRRVRSKRFEPYPNVKETLDYLKKSGVIIIAVSNAPYFQALMRLKSLRIDQYYLGIVSWEGYPIPEDEFTREFVDVINKAKYKTKIEKIWKLPKDKLKPNLEGYKMILDYFQVQANNLYIVGDSISKDVNPAIELGANGIWARYGTEIKEKSLNTVLSITNWSSKKVKNIYEDKSKEPDLIIDDFYQLTEIIETPQLKLDF